MADLANFLHLISKTGGNVSPELYQHFGGDDILAQLQKYDPNARWSDSSMGGGEGGEGQAGKRLDFDLTKLPKSKMGTAGYDLRPVSFGSAGLINDKYQVHDDRYGDVTNSKNIKKPAPGALEILAPLLVTMGAPMLGGALAGLGIGGAAGLTAGVTGSGLGGGAPSWLASLVKGGPGMMDKLRAGDYAGVGGKLGGMTLSQLAGRWGF